MPDALAAVIVAQVLQAGTLAHTDSGSGLQFRILGDDHHPHWRLGFIDIGQGQLLIGAGKYPWSQAHVTAVLSDKGAIEPVGRSGSSAIGAIHRADANDLALGIHYHAGHLKGSAPSLERIRYRTIVTPEGDQLAAQLGCGLVPHPDNLMLFK